MPIVLVHNFAFVFNKWQNYIKNYFKINFISG